MQQMILLQNLLLAQHVSGTIIPIIRSSRVKQHPANRTHNPQLYTIPNRQLENQAPNTTGRNHLYNTLELLIMGIIVPETCWASNKICNKTSSVASSWHFISRYTQYEQEKQWKVLSLVVITM